MSEYVDMTMATTTSPSPGLLPGANAGVELIAKFFRALGDPTRLRLLAFLLDAPRTVGECVAHVGLSQGRVSSHLACLAGCGYVSSRRERRHVYYQVTDPRVADLISLVQRTAADNSAALARCLRIDPPAEDAITRPRAR